MDALTTAEAAALRHCSVDTIRRAIGRGELPVVRVGRTVRIPREALGEQAEVTEALAPVVARLDFLTKLVSKLTQEKTHE